MITDVSRSNRLWLAVHAVNVTYCATRLALEPTGARLLTLFAVIGCAVVSIGFIRVQVRETRRHRAVDAYTADLLTRLEAGFKIND